MNRMKLAIVLAPLALLGTPGGAWADGTVIVAREENKPATIEVQAGEEVRWVNATGGIAHIAFAGSDGAQFYVGGDSGRVKFTRAGTYDYTVHVTGTKAHAHRGSVVVR